MATKASIDTFLDQKALGIVGVSRTKTKFGSAVYRELKGKGREVFPINPNATEIEGETCYPDLASLPSEVTGAVMVVPPAAAVETIRNIGSDSPIRHIWFQRGSQSKEALDLCAEKGIDAVHGECILMFADPVTSIHKFHRFLKKLFGGLPK